MNEYHHGHGGDIYVYDKPVIDFSANVNPLGFPAGVAQAISDSVGSCTHYPDPLNRALGKKLAAHENIPVEFIQWGNGAADLIYRIAYGLKPKTALVLAPTFCEYELALKNVECHVHYYFLKKKYGYQVMENILPLISKVDIVFLCNPNNPTGKTIKNDLLKDILAQCEKWGTILVIDECFNGFLDDPKAHSMKYFVEKSRGLIILQAFTKLYAMAGLRLGYALCQPALGLRINQAGQPWPVSTVASMAGIAALDAKGYVEQTKMLIRAERAYLLKALEALGLEVYPGEANYLFFYCSNIDLKKHLLSHQILIRDCSNYVGLCQGYFRIAIKNHKENSMLIEALKKIIDRRV